MTLPADKVQKILDLWAAGRSTGTIMALLRCTSPGVVVGTVWRARQKGDPRAAERLSENAQRHRKRTYKKLQEIRKRGAVPPPSPAEVEEMKKAESAADPRPAKLVRTIDLEPHHCRAVYGHPKLEKDYGHCGKDRISGTPYCWDHLKRYLPLMALKRARLAETEKEKAEA
jgi:hypothetical protein